MKPALRINRLCKEYTIGARSAPYVTLRETVSNAIRLPLRRLLSGERRERETIVTVLKDLSFEVEAGEVIGVVGHNGAGKSTLLKILSRITEPTDGSVELHGRVGSLLEVGAGFHPELTGRENIYLNGAILGMSKAEVKASFDSIAAFAGVDRFLDTPVKYYSSGMYVRLGFAVAVHLTTELLFIDEVLAVGDAQFQLRCLEKIQHMRSGGRTILFVSHNLSALRVICQRGLLLEAGRLIQDGPINEVIDSYLTRLGRGGDGWWENCETESFVVEMVSVQSLSGSVIKTFDCIEIKVQIRPKVKIGEGGVYVSILSSENYRVSGLDFRDFGIMPKLILGQSVQVVFTINNLPLLPGMYKLEFHVKDMATHKIEIVPKVIRMEVSESSVYGGRKLDNWFGLVGLRASVECRPMEVHDEELYSADQV